MDNEKIDRDWTDDLSGDHTEFGTLECNLCGHTFVGHHKRVICKECATSYLSRDNMRRILARWTYDAKAFSKAANSLRECESAVVWASSIHMNDMRADTIEHLISELDAAAHGSLVPEPGEYWKEADDRRKEAIS